MEMRIESVVDMIAANADVYRMTAAASGNPPSVSSLFRIAANGLAYCMRDTFQAAMMVSARKRANIGAFTTHRIVATFRVRASYARVRNDFDSHRAHKDSLHKVHKM